MVESWILRFYKGSAAGPCGLSPDVLRLILSRGTPYVQEKLASALARFINVCLEGKISNLITPFFAGARLIALSKPVGGIRPIAVGNTLRRLVSKLACKIIYLTAGEYFVPRQLGISQSAGAEAAIHAVRNGIDQKVHDEGSTAYQGDFKNAFNRCDRSTFPGATRQTLPEIPQWTHFYYKCGTREYSAVFDDFFKTHRLLA